MDRIEIDLGAWEDSACPICTKDVRLEEAERSLYIAMTNQYYKYTDEEIERYLNGEGDDWERDKFMCRLCEEEEKIVLECGGVYYEEIEQ
jgi:hypothetical protein